MDIFVSARKRCAMNVSDLATRISAGERRALAQAITLVESGRADHRAQAAELLAALPADRQALRIGLSGTPGVGKSTFIESFGLMLTGQGKRVAVLAVDPSAKLIWAVWPAARERRCACARPPDLMSS